MDIQKMSVIELKAVLCDEMIKRDSAIQNIQILAQKIQALKATKKTDEQTKTDEQKKEEPSS